MLSISKINTCRRTCALEGCDLCGVEGRLHSGECAYFDTQEQHAHSIIEVRTSKGEDVQLCGRCYAAEKAAGRLDSMEYSV